VALVVVRVALVVVRVALVVVRVVVWLVALVVVWVVVWVALVAVWGPPDLSRQTAGQKSYDSESISNSLAIASNSPKNSSDQHKPIKNEGYH
jgi:hypothetical protein